MEMNQLTSKNEEKSHTLHFQFTYMYVAFAQLVHRVRIKRMDHVT